MPTTRRYELTDEQWQKIEHLLPGREGCPGGHAEDNRLFVNAIIWIARTSALGGLARAIWQMEHRVSAVQSLGKRRRLASRVRGDARP